MLPRPRRCIHTWSRLRCRPTRRRQRRPGTIRGGSIRCPRLLVIAPGGKVRGCMGGRTDFWGVTIDIQCLPPLTALPSLVAVAFVMMHRCIEGMPDGRYDTTTYMFLAEVSNLNKQHQTQSNSSSNPTQPYHRNHHRHPPNEAPQYPNNFTTAIAPHPAARTCDSSVVAIISEIASL